LQFRAGELKGEPTSDPGDVFEGIRDDLTSEDMEALGTILDLCNWKDMSSVTAAPNDKEHTAWRQAGWHMGNKR